MKQSITSKTMFDRFFGFKGIDFNGDLPDTKELYRQNLSIAWPSVIEGMLLSATNMVDTMMVGTLGKEAIAAVNLTSQPRMILLLFGQALCVGTTAIIARRKGEGNRESANSTLAQSMYLMTFLGILMSVLGYVFAMPFMKAVGANADTLMPATDYFRIICLGLTANFWTLCICAGMRAIGKTRITAITNIIANIVNVCLNYCLIGGHLGFPALGVRGAAIATISGYLVACVIAFYMVTKKNGYLRFRPSLPRFEKKTLSSLVSVGTSSMAESVFMRIGFLTNQMLIAGCGTSALAAYAVVQQITGLSFTIGDGLATAGTTMVGQSLGAKNKSVARAHVQISYKLGLIASVLLITILFFARSYFPTLFTSDTEVITGASLAFIAVVFGIMSQNCRVIYAGCLRGAGDVKYVAFVSLISVAIVRPIMTWICCYPLNKAFPALWLAFTGPWISYVIDAYVRHGMLAVRIKQGKWLDIKL